MTLGELDVAFDRKHRRLALRRKRHRQLRVQQSGGHAEGEVHRDVVHVLGHVELLDVDVHRRFERVLERLGATLQRERRLVHARRERRLHVFLDPVGQVGQEGNGDVDLAHGVVRTHRAVVESHAAVEQPDVVQGEQRLLGVPILGRALGGELRHQVAEVVGLAVLEAHHVQVGPLEQDLLEHRRTANDRAVFEVERKLFEAEERFRPTAFFDGQPFDPRFHGKGIDVDVLDRHLAPELLAQVLYQVMLGDRRNDEEADDGDQDQERREPDRDVSQDAAGAADGLRGVSRGGLLPDRRRS